jgi:hypothetical protein
MQEKTAICAIFSAFHHDVKLVSDLFTSFFKMEVLYDNVYESYFSDGSGKVT